MKIRISELLMLAMATQILLSCTKELGGDSNNGWSPLTFSASTANSFDVKASQLESISKFTAAGYNADGSDWLTEREIALPYSNQDFKWINGAAHTFYGYANIPASGASASITKDGVTLEYTDFVPGVDQKDAVLGVYYGDGDRTGTAAMTFYHPLACVQFKIGTISGVTKLTDVSIDGLFTAGSTTLKFSTPVVDGVANPEWTGTSGSGKVSLDGLNITSFTQNDNIGDSFFCIPSLLSDAVIGATVEINGEPKALEARLGAGSLALGKVTNILISYENSPAGLSFTTTVSPWVEESPVDLDTRRNVDVLFGHEYVPIVGSDGKTLRWATMNVGATSVKGVDSYGDLFSWGEVRPKSNYDITYYSSDAKRLSGNIEPNSIYDAARDNWGGSWRMPTLDEYTKMRNATYWVWDGADGGYYVFYPDESHSAGGRSSSFDGTLNKSDALIFLPAAGYSDDSSRIKTGTYAFYWTSNYYNSNHAYTLEFYNSNVTFNSYNRHCGRSVRPVSD